MRVQAPLVALLLMAATGPFGVVADPDDGQVPWALRDCRFVYVVLQVPIENVLPFMAPGLTPLSADGDTARVPLGVNHCAEAQVGDVVVQDAGYAQISVIIEEPDGLGRPGVGGYYQLFDVVLTDEARQAALADMGVETRLGSIDHVSLPVESGTGGVRATQVQWGDLGTVRIAGAGGGISPGGGRFVDFASSDTGLVGFQVDWSADLFAFGPGTVQVPPGTLLADIVGGPVAQATVSVGTWTYDPAFVYVP